jgi:uncharacterized SAM-binding protein YcdF (DUF218 family)
MFMRGYLILALVFSLLLTNCSLFNPSYKKLYSRSLKKHSQYDAIIVPGVPFVEPEWDRVMLMRVIWAVHLYKRGYAKHLIMSGGAVYSPYVEARIMKLYAQALGVPAEDISTEERAEHSTENVWYSYNLAKCMGFNTVALASDAFQTNLLYRFMRRRVPEVQFLPAQFDTLSTLSHATPIVDYKPFRLDSFVALPDRESKWQRLRGTRGKHINFKDKSCP